MNTLHTAELGFRRALVPLDGSMVAATPLLEWLQVLTAVRSGEAPQEIIAAARELTAGVIAMTTHGRTGLKRLLFGSVAEAVLRMADIPSVHGARLAPRGGDASGVKFLPGNSYMPVEDPTGNVLLCARSAVQVFHHSAMSPSRRRGSRYRASTSRMNRWASASVGIRSRGATAKS
jgi:hypothetical protein